MKAYISTYSTVSRIGSHENGILTNLDHINEEVQHPSYKEILPANLIRRMGGLLKMSLGSALLAKGDQEISGIFVGTALGCLDNTDKFLREAISKPEGLLAPTSFIQSTHNSIAGQIGLILKNHGYNTTHTNEGSSFETALIDAILYANETNQKMLVGGVDEKTEAVVELANRANLPLNDYAEGSTFFVIDNSAKQNTVMISDIQVRHDFNDLKDAISGYIGTKHPDVILIGNSNPIIGSELNEFDSIEVINYSNYSGIFPTNVGFGIQMAAEMILSTSQSASHILVVNNYGNKTVSFTSLQKA